MIARAHSQPAGDPFEYGFTTTQRCRPNNEFTLIYIYFLFDSDWNLPQRFETRAHFTHEELRLFPGGEVGAFGELVVVDELHISFL
jgi:hypothetical protein